MHDLTPPLSHYEFQRSIALAWLCPEQYWKEGGDKMTVTTNTRPTDAHTSTPSTTVTTEPSTSRITRASSRASSSRPKRSIAPSSEEVSTITAPSINSNAQCTRVRIEDRTLVEGSPLNIKRLSVMHPHFPTATQKKM